MKTLFNFLKMGGGRIIFCLTLALFVIEVHSQTPVSFTGNSLFRNYNFGVKNHCFEISNRYSTTDPPGEADECTSTCPSSYGGEFNASENLNGNDNDISVHPYSANDFDDYINGVTTADAALIYLHVNEEQYITDPYKLVAADCNENCGIDAGDAEQIEDLIGEDIPFTRNSWEWFNQKEIIDNYGSFQSDPYSWTISDRYSGYIFWLDVSTSTLSSGTTQPQFFYYLSTKVGDVHNQSNPNNWVCGTYSLKGDDDQENSLRIIKADRLTTSLAPGTKFKVYFKYEHATENVFYFQMPLIINYNYLNINKISTCPDMIVKHRPNELKNEFIAYCINKNLMDNQKNNCRGYLVTLDIEVLQDVGSLDQVLSINGKKNLEAGNIDFLNLKPYIEIKDIERPSDPYYINDGRIYYSGALSHKVELQFFSLSGQLIRKLIVMLNPGYNDFQEIIGVKTYQIVRIIDHDRAYTIKVNY
ncbi:MAG: hypothetical protein IPM92_00785 [Saprospiraceae bacterium]|nr:hypothetical protein [Saprospiraceae bacterium]